MVGQLGMGLFLVLVCGWWTLTLGLLPSVVAPSFVNNAAFFFASDRDAVESRCEP